MIGFIIFLVILFVDSIMGFVTLTIAKNKLRSSACFFLGFCLSFIGVIIVLILKDYRPYIKKAGIEVVLVPDEETDKEIKKYFYEDKEIEDYSTIRAIISKWLADNSEAVAFPTSNSSQPNLQYSKLDELTKASHLLKENLISKEEFEKLKQEIIGN